MAGGELTGPESTLQGKPCPKCGYVRTAADTNPAWQCPQCLIAYLKYQPGAQPLRARVVASGRELAAEAQADRSAYLLLATNLFALGVAYWTGMSLLELMVVYWIQSMIIGTSLFVRILSLKQFSAEQQQHGPQDSPSFLFPDPNEDVAFWEQLESDDPASKRTAAFRFFALYVVVHLIYLALILAPLPLAEHAPRPILNKGLYLCALAFAANHAYSLIHNIINDRRGRPYLRSLMSLPYYRIVPMHVTMAMGGALSTSTVMMIVFVLLKTIADVVMHSIEHHILRTGRLLPPPKPE